MQISFWWIVKRFILVGLLAACALHLFLQYQVGTSEFKSFAEAKVGDFLKARVHVQNIEVGFLNRVALKGLEIRADEKDAAPYNVRVRQIVFRYNLIHLITRNFKAPSTIILQDPDLRLQDSGFPYALFGAFHPRLSGDAGAKGLMPFQLELNGGELKYNLRTLQSELRLKGIRGSFRSVEEGKIFADFSAELDGFAAGQIHVRGEIDPERGTHRLELRLKSVTLSEKSPFPLESIQGNVRWEGDNLYFEDLRAHLHGWETSIGGQFLNLGSKPSFDLDWLAGKKEMGVRLALSCDLSREEVHGTLKIAGEPEKNFKGKIKFKDLTLVFDRLLINDYYHGKGQFDLQSGDSRFDLEEGIQRFSVQTNLRDLDFDLGFDLNHFKMAGLDVVTGARVRLRPESTFKDERGWRFQADLSTDYLILEYIPFEDFQARFQVDSYGIKNFIGSWGGAFEIYGGILFKGKTPEMKFQIKVHDFDLTRAREIGIKPLPRRLEGLLEGKLKLEGPLRKPEVTGNFAIKSGILNRLSFDRAMFRFRGFPPHLPLEDSRVLKGRTTLYIVGALDLSLSNMFHGVRIQTADNFVIWKGWAIDGNEATGDFEIQKAIGNLPVSMALKPGSTPPGAGETNNPQEDSYVTLGPKIKF